MGAGCRVWCSFFCALRYIFIFGTVCGQVKMGKAFITCFFNFISQGKRVMEN